MSRAVSVGVSLALLTLAAGVAHARGDREAPLPPPFAAEAAAADSPRFVSRVTNANLIGVTVSNYGFVGNNFTSRSPSLEFPVGTGYEHLVRGGLWIGGVAQSEDSDTTFTSVVTGAVDGQQGSSAQQATEFTAAGIEIKARSTLPNSKVFNRAAVSELDLIGEFSDVPAKRALNNNEDHRPLKILVKQENYMWSFSRYQNLIVFHFTITNNGPPITGAWVGFYGEFASGAKSAYSGWPPSQSTGGPLAGWYGKKWMAYDDSLRLLREHYCTTAPIPAQCLLDRVPYWMGVKLLGTKPEPVSSKTITMAAWDWEPGSPDRDEDTERYAIMSSGDTTDLMDPTLLPANGQGGDPVTILAVGPFAQIDPGESIVVDFALVGGPGLEDASEIQENARFAQRAFDRGYVVPVPPPSPRLRVIARDGALDLYWDNSPEAFEDTTGTLPLDFEGYRIYVSEDRNVLAKIAEFDKATAPHDTVGFNTGLPPSRCWEIDDTDGVPTPCEDVRPELIDGDEYYYKYTIPSLRNGFKYFTAVTSYDLGTDEIESLESGVVQNKTLAIPGPRPEERAKRKISVFPNPYRVEARWDRGRQVRDHYLWFTNLPARCMIRIYTLGGDLVYQTPFAGADYRGEGARGVYNPESELDVEPPTLSGTTYAWNMITGEGQAVATGLYLYSIEDLFTREKTVGKFLIVKSDREGF